MTALPKYKINDQVIVRSKESKLSYALAIILSAMKNGGGWVYELSCLGEYKKAPESMIAGVVFESRDKLVYPKLNAAENNIQLD